jgi:hypothetical protein
MKTIAQIYTELAREKKMGAEGSMQINLAEFTYDFFMVKVRP